MFKRPMLYICQFPGLSSIHLFVFYSVVGSSLVEKDLDLLTGGFSF